MLTPKGKVPLYAMLILLFLLLYAVLTVYFNYKYANLAELKKAQGKQAIAANETPLLGNASANDSLPGNESANASLPGNESANESSSNSSINEPELPLNTSQNNTNATG
jgi:hypothetical protein